MNYWELFSDIFYIFGSWAMVYFAYVMGRAGVRRKYFDTTREKWKYGVGLFFPAFGAMAFIIGAGTLGFAYDDKWYTLQGAIQAVVVIGIPVGVGIISGLTTSTVSEPLSSQSSDVSPVVDSSPSRE